MLLLKPLIVLYFVLFLIPIKAQIKFAADSIKVTNYSGLVFEKESVYRVADSSYVETIQLLNLDNKAQAVQFRLLINKATDDSTILVFRDIQKGSDLSDPSWLLDYNVNKGPIYKNGASQDEVYVLLYNQDLKNGLSPGDYNNLFNVHYELVALSDLQDDIKTSIKISNAIASTSDGFAINITSSRDELKVVVRRK